MPLANLTETITIFEDIESPSNPQRKVVDWKRAALGIPLDQVFSERVVLAPGVTRTFEASAYTDLSGTPVSTVVVPAQPGWYQVRGSLGTGWITALGNPASTVTVTPQTDGATVILTGSGLTTSGVQAGFQVYLAGAQYGDTGPWNASNQGLWKVISVSATALILQRVYPQDPPGFYETVTIASANDIQALSNARPRWLYIRGSGIFGGLKQVLAAVNGWVAIPLEAQFTPLGGATFEKMGLTPYYFPYIRVEVDAECAVHVGSIEATANEETLLPLTNFAPAWYESFGLNTSLDVKNVSTKTVNVNVIYAVSLL